MHIFFSAAILSLFSWPTMTYAVCPNGQSDCLITYSRFFSYTTLSLIGRMGSNLTLYVMCNAECNKRIYLHESCTTTQGYIFL